MILVLEEMTTMGAYDSHRFRLTELFAGLPLGLY